MGNAVLDIIYWFWGWVVVVFLLMVVYSGARYFLAGGNKEKRTRAGKIFVYSLVGLFLLYFLYIFSIPISEPLLY